jgi:hypothetical protein
MGARSRAGRSRAAVRVRPMDHASPDVPSVGESDFDLEELRST